MHIILSPSKSVMKQSEPVDIQKTEPLFAPQTDALVHVLKIQTTHQLQETLQVSKSLTELNHARYAEWDNTQKRASLWLYSGDVYNGIDAYSLEAASIEYAQDHVLIVSGLYGLLRPLDKIQPYRLEMKLPIKINNTGNLYEYWEKPITQYFTNNAPKTVLMCASKEYAKAVKTCLPNGATILTPRFLQPTDTGLKEKGFFAKYARGALARWTIDNQITDRKLLEKYNKDGFTFSSELSSETELVYIIPQNFTLAGRFKKL